MEQEDLTASHWDDVLSSRPFDSSKIILENGFQEEDPHPNLGFNSLPMEQDNPFNSNDESDEDNEDISQEHTTKDIEESNGDNSRSVTNYDAESEQLAQLKLDEYKEHRSQLLTELTNRPDIDEIITSQSPQPKIGDNLFKETTSPLKLSSMKSNSNLTTSNNGLSKSQLFSRPRKYSPKVTIENLKNSPLGPLGGEDSSTENLNSVNQRDELFKEIDAPLYEISKKQVGVSKSCQDLSGDALSNDSNEPKINAKNSNITYKKPPTEESSHLDITVGDPMKVGDITNAHIVYTVTTKDKNNTSDVKEVTRRYRDFRWIYHQLQNNHPGVIIPPPPAKQMYIGRFNENFIENRRLMLEKMLTKIASRAELASDSDFQLFLTSSNFVNDSQERERLSGSESIHNREDNVEYFEEPSTTGFMSSLFSISNKITEPNDELKDKKVYIEDLETNLKNFEKSLEAIGNQRSEIITFIEQISIITDEIASIEISKRTGDILAEFSEIHLKLKENYDRVSLQEQLTLGFTIEEYLRIIGSIKAVFATRSKIYNKWQQSEAELSKKQQNMEKFKRKTLTQVDKIKLSEFEVEKLKQKTAKLKSQFHHISEVFTQELERFEFDKIDDFRNSVEIFIESSIEAQKESIELWESFYEKQLS